MRAQDERCDRPNRHRGRCSQRWDKKQQAKDQKTASRFFSSNYRPGVGIVPQGGSRVVPPLIRGVNRNRPNAYCMPPVAAPWNGLNNQNVLNPSQVAGLIDAAFLAEEGEGGIGLGDSEMVEALAARDFDALAAREAMVGVLAGAEEEEEEGSVVDDSESEEDKEEGGAQQQPARPAITALLSAGARSPRPFQRIAAEAMAMERARDETISKIITLAARSNKSGDVPSSSFCRISGSSSPPPQEGTNTNTSSSEESAMRSR